jgi:hypothetical protein
MTPTEAAFIVSGLAAVLLSCWRISRYVTKAHPSAEGAVFLRLLVVSFAAIGVGTLPRGPLWLVAAFACVLAGFWWVPAPTWRRG